MEEIEEGEYVYEMIVDHRFENGILKLKTKYYNEINAKGQYGGGSFWDCEKG